jgi:hypothetical protein
MKTSSRQSDLLCTHMRQVGTPAEGMTFAGRSYPEHSGEEDGRAELWWGHQFARAL